jgi:hypothetical protein
MIYLDSSVERIRSEEGGKTSQTGCCGSAGTAPRHVPAVAQFQAVGRCF